MFSTPRVNFIESDEGFSVEGLGRTGLRYSERGKTMRVSSELLAASSPRLLVIYADSIRNWDPPYSAEVVDEKTKNRIIDNIRAALRSQGQEIDVIDPSVKFGPYR